MSKQQRYTEEFKLAAVKQVTERNYPVAEVAERLGISSHSLYVWIKRYSQPEAQQQDDSSQQAEIRRLKAELRRVTDELHIPVENEHLFRFKMNADSGLRVHRFRTPQSANSDVR